jgi:hypothetical protein
MGTEKHYELKAYINPSFDRIANEGIDTRSCIFCYHGYFTMYFRRNSDIENTIVRFAGFNAFFPAIFQIGIYCFFKIGMKFRGGVAFVAD